MAEPLVNARVLAERLDVTWRAVQALPDGQLGDARRSAIAAMANYIELLKHAVPQNTPHG